MIKKLSFADLFSVLNCTFGFVGICQLLKGGYFLPFLYLSALMDGMDGFLAKRFGNSPLGKDLDSLADLVSFGVFPALLIAKSCVWIGLIYLTSAMLRLARFNVLDMEDFLGLPTTASALALFTALRLGLDLRIIAIPLSLLMISDLRYERIRDRRLLLVVGLVIMGNIFTVFAVYVLSVMLVCYILSPGMRGLVRLTSRLE